MLTPGGWGRRRERSDPHATVRATLPPVATAEPASERPARSRAWKAAGPAGLLGAAAVVALEVRGVDARWLIGTLQLVTAAAVGAGARLHRPASAWPWWLLAGGFAVNGVRRVLLGSLPASAVAEVEWALWVTHPVSLTLYLATAATVVVLRSRSRSAEQLLDAAILTLAAGLVAVEAVRMLITAPASPIASSLSPSLVVAFGVTLLVLTVHLFHSAVHGGRSDRGHLVLALLVGAAAIRLGRDVVIAVVTVDGGAVIAAGLTPVALGMAAAAMLHPASSQVVEPTVERRAPSTARQLAAIASPLLVLPLLGVSLTLAEPGELAGTLVTGAGMIVLTVLVIARLERLLRSLQATTALRQAEARRDLPTGLPNTRGLFDELAERAGHHETAGPPALLMVSLAGVGEAGSVHGLEVSAGLLEGLARRLSSALPSDAFIAALSGRDLAVIVAVDSDEQLDELGLRVCELASQAVVVGDIPVSCRASVGIAVREPNESPEDLLRRADLASRWAERTGPAGVRRYNSPMNAHVAYEVAVRADLRDAIRRDEIRMWCQPQLEIPSGRLAGVECLARWRHPGYGSVPPAEFVPAAHEIGAAAELDVRMVRRAVEQAGQWRAAGLFVPRVAVNVEPTSLSEPGFVDAVASALRTAQLPPGSLEIEVTEAVTVRDHAEVRQMLWQLRALGVRLAVDDFGTGYSSLAALHHLPVDAIKLDRELITLLGDDPVLVSATIALAHRLGLAVVAEGVETHAELAVLERVGCRVAQGYLLAEPMPADELFAWHEASSTGYPAAV